MALVVDPQGREVRALARAADWTGASVLEIGCGDGRLTRRIASLGPRRIVAIDPERDAVRRARASLPARLRRRIEYRVGSALRLPWRAHEFDCVVFAWAL